MKIIENLTSKLPRSIETGFGPLARHLSFEVALTKISERLRMIFKLKFYHSYFSYVSMSLQKIVIMLIRFSFLY